MKHLVDIVVVTEKWLNSGVESSFERIPGYTQWIKRDRRGRQGSGVEVCLKEGVKAKRLDVETSPTTEVVFIRVQLMDGTVLLPVCHVTPPMHGSASLEFLTEQMDDCLTRYRCRHDLTVGDLTITW